MSMYIIRAVCPIDNIFYKSKVITYLTHVSCL